MALPGILQRVLDVAASLAAHAALTNAHSATSADSASCIMMRDSAGRARVKNPAHVLDIVNLQTLNAAIAEVEASAAGFPDYANGAPIVAGSFTASENCWIYMECYVFGDRDAAVKVNGQPAFHTRRGASDQVVLSSMIPVPKGAAVVITSNWTLLHCYLYPSL